MRFGLINTRFVGADPRPAPFPAERKEANGEQPSDAGLAPLRAQPLTAKLSRDHNTVFDRRYTVSGQDSALHRVTFLPMSHATLNDGVACFVYFYLDPFRVNF